ncbi:unnamed protein product [Discula destructiva]
MLKPTIVAIPGAWHSAEFFKDVRASFESLGYPFVSRDAPSIQAEKALTATGEEDAQFVRNDVLLPLLDTGGNIVVLMHSYGGLYGSAAVQGLSKSERLQQGKQGGVLALIYVSAVVPLAGKSCLDMMGTKIDSLPPFSTYDESTGIVCLSAAEEVMYHDLQEGEAEKWISKLKPQSLNAMNTPVSYSPVGDLFYKGKLGYIICGKDKLIPVAGQAAYADMAGIELKILVQEASHAFWATACNDVIDAAIALSEEIQSL